MKQTNPAGLSHEKRNFLPERCGKKSDTNSTNFLKLKKEWVGCEIVLIYVSMRLGRCSSTDPTEYW